MAITINGSANTVAGLAVGGLPDGTVDADTLASNAVTNVKVADDAIGVAELSTTGTAGSGNYLRGDNAWAAAGGGKILQVVKGTALSGSYTTTITANSTYTDVAGTTHAITPSATSSKILVIYRFQATARCGGNDGVSNGKTELQRDIAGAGYTTIDNMQFRDPWSANNGDTYWNPAHIVLDAPNTTSACNYKLRGWKSEGDRIRFWDTNEMPSEQFLLIEVGA